MKAPLLLISFLVFSGIISAQDTIFVKSGQSIPVIIVEKNDTEIKYKKFGQPEPAAIYSVFISDISSIHFKDGIIADYTSTGQNVSENKPASAVKMAGTMRASKWSLGVSRAYFKRNQSDNLLLFWKNRVGNNAPEIGGNTVYYPISLKMSFVLGNSGRNWIGDELQLMLTPTNAIYASNNDGSNQIQFRSFYSNIAMYYGHTLNHKKTLAAIIEPGLDIAFMSGFIKLTENNKTTIYDISANNGFGFHLALGLDWNISKRLLATGRIGKRFMTVEESHENSESSTGYSTFYVNPAKNDDLLSVKWSGPYASVGICWSFYTKMKFGNVD